jgi:hypothetical protein
MSSFDVLELAVNWFIATGIGSTCPSVIVISRDAETIGDSSKNDIIRHVLKIDFI